MEQREKLNELGRKVLEASRTEILLEMRFLGPALGSLSYRMDLSTHMVGTDAAAIRFNPTFLTQTYLEQPLRVNRAYLHMLMHCLFRHMFGASLPEHGEEALWDLASDIAAESVVDSLDYPCLRRSTSDLREQTYEKLHGELGVLTAEKIYHYLDAHFLMTREEADAAWARARHILEEYEAGGRAERGSAKAPSHCSGCGETGMHCRAECSGAKAPSAMEAVTGEAPSKAAGQDAFEIATNDENVRGETEDVTQHRPFQTEEKAELFEKLRAEFEVDDHQFWGRPQQNKAGEDAPALKQPNIAVQRGSEREEQWEKTARQVEAEVTANRLASAETGNFDRVLSFSLRRRTSLTEYLKKYTVLREEAQVDPDSFDYGMYYFGMEMYGNMPLIEENEFRESRRIDELVIAIDTSGSTQARLVRLFLDEVAGVLAAGENFFHRVHLHILECDDRVQRDEVVTDMDQIRRYAEGFTVSGGFGTDYRPVFQYVEELRRMGALRNLRGLLYFTDGYGIYPQHPTPYETAFVFLPGSDSSADKVPDWAVKIFL